MRVLFVLSYAFLWALVAAEAILLREVLERTVWFKRLYSEFARRNENQWLLAQLTKWLPAGTPAPEFCAPVLGTDHLLEKSDLEGHTSILLFLSSEEATSRFYEKLTNGIYALWHKVDGHLYLVCKGGERPCRSLARNHHVTGLDEIPVVLDEDSRIAQSFFVTATPQAVELDESVRVKSYGYPIPFDEPGTLQAR